MHKPLLQAIEFAVNDRKRSWHSRHAPEENLDPQSILADLEDPLAWRRMITTDVAVRRALRAVNGREYPITFLPIHSFALRYRVVCILSRHFDGLWTARLNGEFLNCTAKHSLFLGRARVNEQVYRKWRSAQTSKYLLKVDISSFYPSIHHRKLCEILKSSAAPHDNAMLREALDLVPIMLRYRYIEKENTEIQTCEQGLPIGNTTERFFSNIYLSSIDHYLTSQPDISSCRKLDDIRVYSDRRARLEEVLAQIESLATDLYLNLNVEKTRICRFVKL